MPTVISYGHKTHTPSTTIYKLTRVGKRHIIKEKRQSSCSVSEGYSMQMKALQCPNCGANLPSPDDQPIRYCSYCGAALITDDETQYVEYHGTINAVIRDEARIKEAENESRRIRLQERRLARKEEAERRARERRADRIDNFFAGLGEGLVRVVGGFLKSILILLGVIIFSIVGLIYTILPFDLLPGLPVDDIILVIICFFAVKWIWSLKD